MSENESITFRLNAPVLITLRGNAAENKISLNTLVNQVLSSFVEWEMTSVEAGFVTIHKDIIKELFNAIDVEVLKKIAIKTADSIRGVNLLIFGKDDVEAILSCTRNSAKRSGIRIREMDDGQKKIVILQHDMGRNWSEFFREHLMRMINNADTPVEIDITDNTLLIRLPK